MTITLRRSLLAAALVAAAGTGWYLFRPDALVRNVRVDEALPVAAMPAASPAPTLATSPRLLAMGRLHDVAHAGSGEVSIHALPDGRRVLRLSELQVDNGPDLYVYLVAAPDAFDDATVAGAATISLGKLKGNQGNQNYELPADVDLSRYRAVTIWCQRFGVNFATAPLMGA